MSWNKGDTILCAILAATIAFFGADLWLIVHGLEQWASGAWTCFAVVFGGELLSFALYRVGKGRNDYRASTGKHEAVDKLNDDRKAG